MMMVMPRPVILLAPNHIAPETFIEEEGWRNIYYQQGENSFSRLWIFLKKGPRRALQLQSHSLRCDECNEKMILHWLHRMALFSYCFQ